MRTYSFYLATALCLILLTTPLAHARKQKGQVEYADPTAVETLTIDFGSTDLQQIAQKLVDDMLVFPPVVQATAERRPTIFVDRIKNKTMEHIDTESITDSIMTKLVQSGKFRYVPRDKIEEVLQEQEFQKSGLVDAENAVRMGKLLGAEYMLYGNFSSIDKRTSRSRDLYYKFTLHLMNVETGVVEWMGEKEIRKVFNRKTFGR